MNEPLGIIEERARVAKQYERFVYQAPRWPTDPPKSEPEPAEPPEVAARPVNLAAEAISFSSGPTIAQVQRAFLGQLWVAGYSVGGEPYTMGHLVSPLRTRQLVVPRHACILAVKTICGGSGPVIGRSFGKRDHTSIRHALKKAPEWLADCANQEVITAYRATLEMFKERAGR